MSNSTSNPKVQESVDFIKKLMTMSFSDRTMAFHEAADLTVTPNFDTLEDIPLYSADGSIKRIVPVSFFLVNAIQDNVLTNKTATWNQYTSVYEKRDSHGFSWQMYMVDDTYKEIDKEKNVLETCNHESIEGTSIIFERKAIYDDVITFFKQENISVTEEFKKDTHSELRRHIFPVVPFYYYNLDLNGQGWQFDKKWEDAKKLFLDQMIGRSIPSQNLVADIIYPFAKKELKALIKYEDEKTSPPVADKKKQKKRHHLMRMSKLLPTLAERGFVEFLLLISSRPVKSPKLADILFAVNIHNYLQVTSSDEKASEKRSVILYNLSNLSQTTTFYNKASRIRRLNKLTDKCFQDYPNKVDSVKNLKDLILAESKRVQLHKIQQKAPMSSLDASKKKSRKVLM